VTAAKSVLTIGAQSSLTGGATPRGELLLNTRRLQEIRNINPETVCVGAGVPVVDLQLALTAQGLYFPPAPTYDGAFLGGTVATNASGAATFKYGSTRPWVEALTIVLADGSVLDLRRGEVIASPEGVFEIETATGQTTRVPIPTYHMPSLAKLSAGYFASPAMDLVDLFIGSEGTLGVIVDATVRVVTRPALALALINCVSEAQALSVTSALRREAHRAWSGEGPLDISGVEYIDNRSIALLSDAAFARAGISRPTAGTRLLIVQLELPDNTSAALTQLTKTLEATGVTSDPEVALPGDEQGAARIRELREAVPTSVNARVADVKYALDARIEKIAGDMIVPFERLTESLALYRNAFEQRDLDYAIWGHISDGNLHPNVIPQSFNDVERGREAFVEITGAVLALGGAPLAEHGVGRNPLKQRFLEELYGEEGLASMRAVKQALDPTNKMAPGVLFSF
jgi:D-lactate dehydrogenase (cytochrome)